ncbi:MAG: hypothetical protein KKA73_04820, partial [Chloroflexi bacterium]|nr:hypothetical protein [Chloroflexota bacterium]
MAPGYPTGLMVKGRRGGRLGEGSPQANPVFENIKTAQPRAERTGSERADLDAPPLECEGGTITQWLAAGSP